MKLKVLPWDLTVCKTVSMEGIDLSAGFFFIGKTDEEVSLVCRTEDTPANTLAREDGWRGFRVAGVLDFSLFECGELGCISELKEGAELSGEDGHRNRT